MEKKFNHENTNIMGAYYASLPLETSLDNTMSSPPLFCRPDDSLDSALDIMRSNGVYRLYVAGLAMPVSAVV
ncbi:MAG: CBS domain-containing protein [Desulfobacterales bacterium]|uniref:CBS domain-containing protein n=1 Tax=Candidatus Desulfatibia vada TaxID=2841696 RepID=A0A8J6TJB2_9BACT|nr:CBS domain-containing protein [Candidatus Desulfatibia vada]MBL6971788.1 CBS domain-containing protein [Desulfobacterales bacterium]